MHRTVRFLPLALLLAATPALAAPAADEPTRVLVNHADLDLTNPAGVETLERRIRQAVRQACPRLTRDLRQSAAARKCQQASAERAKAKVEVAIAEAHAGRPRLAAAAGDKTVAAR
ncbi:UrcA family protein [Sphingopyxis sp. YR583]|uniref:UrcA family protein n=1 Tax=Sphingopyxis sp. YR583 TaxID=1881047 RepID=UPI0008A7E2C0|nr:UrcA family protein [Sphingopyxis sp. YR583]SEH12816.1 UrcA family protein [Sphingopyxis sp. YR583]